MSHTSEPFLYLSLDSQLPAGNPFVDVTSQDRMLCRPFRSDSALRMESASGTQVSQSMVTSESETVSGVELDRADCTPAELPSGQFQLAKNRRRKRRRPETERSALQLVLP